MAIDATHDSVCSVTLRFILQESTPDGFLAHLYDDVEAWKVEASVAVAAGERLVRLAEEIHEFFSYERTRGST